jgi:sugar phosphate permease
MPVNFSGHNDQDIVTPNYTWYADPSEKHDPSKMLEVTLLDALRVREIALLIASYLIREVHNKYLIVNYNHYIKNFSDVYYQVGAIVGLMLTGVLSDFVLRNKRFSLLVLLNCALLAFDFYLFFYRPGDQATQNLVSSLLGMFIEGNDLLYLILIPMTVARKMQVQV